ncbi:MAG: ABC transporter permease [Bifidobacteriaceae bacterium]|jgi:ABC-2 type transport system permease protein|nr:ABC transporter permease [Bifidobacteriaceae bacterium]
MRALIVKEFRELARDKRTFAMLVVLPIVMLTVFGYAANFSVKRVSVVVTGPAAAALAEDIEAYQTAREAIDVVAVEPSGAQATQASLELAARDMLRDQRAAVVIVALPEADPAAPLTDRMRAYADGSALFSAQAAQATFARLAAEDSRDRMTAAQEQLVQALSQRGALASFDPAQFAPPDLDADRLVAVLFNPDLKTSWVIVPGLTGMVLMFIGTLITSIGLVRERETGTLEQLAVMPLRPSVIILGKIVPYFVLALADMVVVTCIGVGLFGVPFTGSLWLYGATAVVFCFAALGVGVLISSVSQNAAQAIQMAIMLLVPQVLLSGLIFPLDLMPLGVRWIGYVLPLTWFREIAVGVMLRDATLGSLWPPAVILVGMAVVVFGAATARMRFALTHGGAR